MRRAKLYSKTDILQQFDRYEVAYRLAILSSHWLRGGDRYKPSAVEAAKTLAMEVRGEWLEFADIAGMLANNETLTAMTSEFVRVQLHALVCVPFELLRDYCNENNDISPNHQLLALLKATPWFTFARLVRNAMLHNFHFHFGPHEKTFLPITWNGIILTEKLDGQALRFELWHKPGYELFVQMRDFAEDRPAAR